MRKLFSEDYAGREIDANEELTEIDEKRAEKVPSTKTDEQQNLNKTLKCFQCEACGRSFLSKGGRTNHQNKCKKKEQVTCTIIQPTIERIQTIPVWGSHTIEDLEQITDALYDEIVKWRKNIFMIPSGLAGKKFIEETTRLITNWNNNSQIGNVSMKLLFVMPSLLLQKPSKSSKSKEHSECLNRRLTKWFSGDFNDIILECRAIQHRFLQSKKLNEESIAKRFSNLMFQGKVNSALNVLSNESSSGVLQMNDEVIKSLLEKHPDTNHNLTTYCCKGLGYLSTQRLMITLTERAYKRLQSRPKEQLDHQSLTLMLGEGCCCLNHTVGTAQILQMLSHLWPESCA